MRAEEAHLGSSRPGPVSCGSIVSGGGKGRFQPLETLGVLGADVPEELEHSCEAQSRRRIPVVEAPLESRP